MHLTRYLGPLALCILLSACTVGPDYRPPELSMPSQWHAAAPDSAPEPDPELRSWWRRFEDPQLDGLIDRALADNVDLAVALARVEEVRALRGVAAADLQPELDAEGLANPASGSVPDLFLAGLDAVWEVDVFGGLRRAVEAADADVDASLESWRAVRLAVVGAVASTYIELRGFQARLATGRVNLEAQRETTALTEAQAQAGLASDLDVQRARALVATTAADLPLLEMAQARSIFRLGVLLGLEPAGLVAEFAHPAPIPAPPPAVVVGVPADLLRRRPDLRRAERELAAATARIGEITSDLYPRFSLTGTVGLRSPDLQNFLEGKGGFAVGGPSITWPILAGGRILANIDAQNARQAQALARYRGVLLAAFEEVETTLDRYAREQVRRRALADAVVANRAAALLARRLYANGLTTFIDVLDAERSQLASEDRLVASEAAVSAQMVALFVALGGGWDAAAEVPL